MALTPTTSFWNTNSQLQAVADQLHKLVPMEGSVANPKKNRALEKFRKASNVYYDLYNNGLCNRAREFRSVFGFGSTVYKRGQYSYHSELYHTVEVVMENIVRAAAREQSIAC
jgi:hypothetical protein